MNLTFDLYLYSYLSYFTFTITFIPLPSIAIIPLHLYLYFYPYLYHFALTFLTLPFYLYRYRLQLNPPYYVPAVEMVPAPWTDPALMERARDLLRGLGQSPVMVKKEIPGFIAPRVQNAMIMECIRLVLVSKTMRISLGFCRLEHPWYSSNVLDCRSTG